MSEYERIKEFHTKLVGVTHDNDDGTSRQKIIRRCRIGENLKLVWQPNNLYDSNAVAICRESGEQVGWLSRTVAEEIVRRGKEGEQFSIEISDLTGGTRSRPTLGVNVKIGVCKI